MKSKFYLFTVALLGLLLSSCSDDDQPTAADATTLVNATIERPADFPEDATIDSEHYSFYNISNGRTMEFDGTGEMRVAPGLYNVDYNANVTNASGSKSTLRATGRNIQIDGETYALNLTAYNTIESDDLVIAEIFFTGTLQASGNQYSNDQYIKLYNNTDHVVYADGITLFGSQFLTVSKYDYTPDIMGEAVSVDAIYTVPGNGTEHPVQPGDYFLIANNGIDHKELNPNSFDLSHADMEWFDESTNPRFPDIDSPTVPNMDRWYSNTATYWSLHNRGFKAYGIARIPMEKDSYLMDNYYDYEYIMHLPVGDFPMSGSAYRINNEWVVDVVNLSIESMVEWTITDPSLDCGWTHCGSVDKDTNRYFKSVRRKMLYLNEQGHPVLKDTNNSTADFNADCIPSEVELQGTATNAEGTPATVKTYDGVTPIN